jgi:hypothetical protein
LPGGAKPKKEKESSSGEDPNAEVVIEMPSESPSS